MSFHYDELDSGNETDSNPAALRLPSGNYDYPLALADKRFDANGVVTFDQLNPEGTLGDRVTVNGKLQPVLRVDRRRYRFRILNGGPSRFYNLNLVNAATVRQTFTYIANDGNLLERPLNNQVEIPLSPAERADIVVDFSRYAANTVLYLENRQRQLDTRGPIPGDLTFRQQLLKIIVVGGTMSDPSRVPTSLRPLRQLPSLTGLTVRRFRFNRSNGQWAINGQFVNVLQARVEVAKESTEIWELENADDGWSHPVHIHFEEGRILSRLTRGVNTPVPARESGRKDTYVLPPGPNSLVRILIRFRDFRGKYVMHCHNLIHEDHAMMLRFDIV
jgi:FtsP/CotA-like multicopper oxidase with cupredoxin domain